MIRARGSDSVPARRMRGRAKLRSPVWFFLISCVVVDGFSIFLRNKGYLGLSMMTSMRMGSWKDRGIRQSLFIIIYGSDRYADHIATGWEGRAVLTNAYPSSPMRSWPPPLCRIARAPHLSCPCGGRDFRPTCPLRARASPGKKSANSCGCANAYSSSLRGRHNPLEARDGV